MFPFWLLVKVYVFTLVVMKVEQYSTLYFPLLIIIFNIFTFNSKALAQMQHKHSNSDKLKSIMNSSFSLERNMWLPRFAMKYFDKLSLSISDVKGFRNAQIGCIIFKKVHCDIEICHFLLDQWRLRLCYRLSWYSY